MHGKKPKIIVVIGPTSAGKSELAVLLAKKLDGEIISADSRQIYKGLNIGTGKVPGKWQKVKSKKSRREHGLTRAANIQNSKVFLYKKIPHHCIDFVSPKRTYTVAEYKKCAMKALWHIVNRGKIPIITGGTGFWIDAVVYDMDIPEAPPDYALRKELEKKNAGELLATLKKLDPERAKTIEQKNPRRLIRAIEIAKTLGKVPAIRKKKPFDALWIGIRKPQKNLDRLIYRRLLSRLNAGMVNEAKNLHRKGIPWKRFYELGLEYKFLAEHIRGKMSKEEMIEGLARAIRQYARRQMTWWKRNQLIQWLPNQKRSEKIVDNFLKEL